MPKPNVALGLSGGVDSALSAHLLIEAGYDVTGVYLECWRAPGCRAEEDRKDALQVALQLNIPFVVLDFKEAYRQKVVELFFAQYAAGLTPNPDIWCNKEIKFGLFYDWVMANHFDFVATGHYAQQKAGHLYSSTDVHKDQTYFLYQLRKEQLSQILFPVGHLQKSAVRAEAQKRSIPVADKKDSVGICFIGDINVHEFLRERLGEKPGNVIDTTGQVIGQHKGLWFYTIGQRHGFDLLPTAFTNDTEVNRHAIPPFYVIEKRPETNELVVGFGAETYARSFAIHQPHWIYEPESTDTLFVRIRHTGQLIPCSIHQTTVQLAEPVQGLASGQAAVFYAERESGLECLGGGTIAL